MAEISNIPSSSSSAGMQPTNMTIPLVPMKIPNSTREQRGHFFDSFSPVNQNGSFEFDRVLKSGQVHKRTRKTKVHLIQQLLYTTSNKE
jgi:hypothetical protein